MSIAIVGNDMTASSSPLSNMLQGNSQAGRQDSAGSSEFNDVLAQAMPTQDSQRHPLNSNADDQHRGDNAPAPAVATQPQPQKQTDRGSQAQGQTAADAAEGATSRGKTSTPAPAVTVADKTKPDSAATACDASAATCLPQLPVSNTQTKTDSVAGSDLTDTSESGTASSLRQEVDSLLAFSAKPLTAKSVVTTSTTSANGSAKKAGTAPGDADSSIQPAAVPTVMPWALQPVANAAPVIRAAGSTSMASALTTVVASTGASVKAPASESLSSTQEAAVAVAQLVASGVQPGSASSLTHSGSLLTAASHDLAAVGKSTSLLQASTGADSTPLPASTTQADSGAGGSSFMNLLSQAMPANVPAISALPLSVAANAYNNPAWAGQVSQRVVWMAQGGITSASISLNPADLGPIQVHVAMNQDHATVQFQASHATTSQLLESMLPKLSAAFDSQGLKLTDVNVSQMNSQSSGSGSFSQSMANQNSGSGSQSRSSNPAGDSIVASTDLVLPATVIGSSISSAVDYYA